MVWNCAAGFETRNSEFWGKDDNGRNDVRLIACFLLFLFEVYRSSKNRMGRLTRA